jgi:hypothetical protein
MWTIFSYCFYKHIRTVENLAVLYFYLLKVKPFLTLYKFNDFLVDWKRKAKMIQLSQLKIKKYL